MSATKKTDYTPQPQNLSMLDSTALPVQVGNTQIIRCEVITVPETRFIGKQYDHYPNWGDAWANGWFEQIEAMGAQSPINDGSYCVLYGKDNNHWIGEFMEAGTPVPEGLDFVDIPESQAVLFFIKGKQGDCFTTAYNTDVINGLIEQLGLPHPADDRKLKAFERDNCPRFTDPDEEGNLILDYIVFMGA
ncbi:MAG: GyrI-like domain-containing protein [Lachnospiraceae bacterium]|jgi:hypothetical protein|nr:GyrI-like domain-containing protein [Lachnospiraceae bacterium]